MSQAWKEAMLWTAKHLADELQGFEGAPFEPSELELKRYSIEVQAIADFMNEPWHCDLEGDRRRLRAEAECASLRLLVKRLADALDAVPGKSTDESELVTEARRWHP